MVRGSKFRRRAGLCLAAVLLIYFASLAFLNREVSLSAADQRTAMAEAADYLTRNVTDAGRFNYIVNLDAKPPDFSYNVLRHAGSIYALAQYYELSSDPKAAETILKAANYLLDWHVRPVAHQTGMRAVYSLPGEEVSDPVPQIKLGGCALGLIALVKARQLDSNLVTVGVLRELGACILFLQQGNGEFRSKYNDTTQTFDHFESLYYPGEAILALALLHEVDPDPRWLEAALKGARFLEESRQHLAIHRLPNDHWLMIGTAAILSQHQSAHEQLISRERLIEHSLAIGRMMMGEQGRMAWVPTMKGAFVPGGVTPSSTRLEGLIALYTSLPPDHAARGRILRSIQSGLAYVVRQQIREGVGKGGFSGGWECLPFKVKGQSEIRIDYVQHALSALVGYYKLATPEPGRSADLGR